MFPFHSLGNLNNGSNAGLFYVNGNNALSNARWNIGSRIWLHSNFIERARGLPRKRRGMPCHMTKTAPFDSGLVAAHAANARGGNQRTLT